MPADLSFLTTHFPIYMHPTKRPKRTDCLLSPLQTMDNDRQRRFQSSNDSLSCSEMRHYLTKTDEQEAIHILHMQFRHDQRITSDDVRSVVRAVANRRCTTSLPLDFPPTRWILEFKRAHGFALTGSIHAIEQPRCLNMESRSRTSIERSTTADSLRTEGSSDDERDTSGQQLKRDDAARNSDTLMQFSMRPRYDSNLQRQHTCRQQKRRRSVIVDNDRTEHAWNPLEPMWSRKELSSNAGSGSGDSENDATTGDSSNSSVNATPLTIISDNYKDGCVSPQNLEPTSQTKRGYKLSHTVSPETWEKAIASVEQQGMSLRAAAKIYGVHFAALHRRVKKRTQGRLSSKGTNGYFHQKDETGIMRVVVARAELGVLMTFNELMKLVEAAALRKFPDISVANARKLMARFQSRNEKLIWHIIIDWPPSTFTLSSSPVASHHHLEHPGYDYASSMSSSSASIQRSFLAHTTDKMAAVVPVAPFTIPRPSSSMNGSMSAMNGNRPMLPSLLVHKHFRRLSTPEHNNSTVNTSVVTQW